MPPSLQFSTHLYVLRRQVYERLLAPGAAGVPTPVAVDGQLFRAGHIPAEGDFDAHLMYASRTLESEHCSLLFMFPSADGAPFRSAKIFAHQGQQRISWQEDSYTHHSADVQHFVSPMSGYTWHTEAQHSKYGWFLTGLGTQTSLWRIRRYDVDAFSRLVFTLSPVTSSAGLPILDVSQVTDELLRAELIGQYAELQTSISRHAYRDVVTKAKNIIEGALRCVLVDLHIEPGRDLFDHLAKLRPLVEVRSAPMSDLSYHLAHKLRLLHGRTHPGSITSSGRSLEPELALTVVQDLREILTDLGFVQT